MITIKAINDNKIKILDIPKDINFVSLKSRMKKEFRLEDVILKYSVNYQYKKKVIEELISIDKDDDLKNLFKYGTLDTNNMITITVKSCPYTKNLWDKFCKLSLIFPLLIWFNAYYLICAGFFLWAALEVMDKYPDFMEFYNRKRDSKKENSYIEFIKKDIAYLKEMGFEDVQSNLSLLYQNDGNMDSVVDILSKKDEQSKEDYPVINSEIYKNQIKYLRELGFTNNKQTLSLLQENRGDLEKVISILCK